MSSTFNKEDVTNYETGDTIVVWFEGKERIGKIDKTFHDFFFQGYDVKIRNKIYPIHYSRIVRRIDDPHKERE